MIASCWDWPSLKYAYFILENKKLDAGGWGPAKGIQATSTKGKDSSESIAFEECLPSLPKESLYVGTGDFCIGEIYEKRDNEPRPNADLEKLRSNGDPQSAKVLDLLNNNTPSVLGRNRDSELRDNPRFEKLESSTPAIWSRLIPVVASLSSGYVVYKGLQGLSKGNLDTKHLLFAWGAGLAIGITVGQEATRATYFSNEKKD